MQRQDRARVIARVPEHARNSGQPPEFLEHTARNRTAGNRATGNRTGENTASFTRELQSSELDTRMTKSLLYQDGVVAMKYHRLERTEEGELNVRQTCVYGNLPFEYIVINYFYMHLITMHLRFKISL